MAVQSRTIPAALVLALASSLLAAQTTQAPADPADAALAPAANPGVRIVRLSEIKGEAMLDRHVDHGYETAFANLPIVQGSKLKTGAGVAEVEFEDNSSLRLTPDTEVEFTNLSRQASGGTTTGIRVLQGTVYASLAKSPANHFEMAFNGGHLDVAPETHLHFFVGTPHSQLAVMEGSVNAVTGGATTVVGKKKSLIFDPANQAAPTLVSKVEKDPYADWDKQAVQYHQRYMNTASFGSSTPLYGLADMNYYGSFQNVAGCGNVWQPYLAGAGFNPYNNGVYAWYGSGYSFVSPYPWGWTAFNSGNWVNCGGNAGWGWQPGAWTGLTNLTAPGIAKGLKFNQPNAPLRGGATLFATNSTPMISSRYNQSGQFEFARNSAGLGVPRETFGRLDHVSATVAQHGSHTVEAYAAPLAQNGARSVPVLRAGSLPGRSETSFANAGTHSTSAGSASRSSMSSSSSIGVSHGGGPVGGGAAAGGSHR